EREQPDLVGRALAEQDVAGHGSVARDQAVKLDLGPLASVGEDDVGQRRAAEEGGVVAVAHIDRRPRVAAGLLDPELLALLEQVGTGIGHGFAPWQASAKCGIRPFQPPWLRSRHARERYRGPLPASWMWSASAAPPNGRVSPNRLSVASGTPSTPGVSDAS